MDEEFYNLMQEFIANHEITSTEIMSAIANFIASGYTDVEAFRDDVPAIVDAVSEIIEAQNAAV